MQEVKAREEEYDYIKTLAGKIEGFPPGFVLARRERRLVAQGHLRKVALNERERSLLDGDIATVAPGQTVGAADGHRPGTPEHTGMPPVLPADAIEKLGPITSPYFTREYTPSALTTPTLSLQDRRRSVISTGYRASGVSQISEWTASYSITSSMTLPQDGDLGLRPNSTASSISPHPFPFLPYAASNKPGHKTDWDENHDVDVYAFVFSDIVLLTRYDSVDRHSTRHADPKGMRLLPRVGMSRVLGVIDHSGILSTSHISSCCNKLNNPSLRGGRSRSPHHRRPSSYTL